MAAVEERLSQRGSKAGLESYLRWLPTRVIAEISSGHFEMTSAWPGDCRGSGHFVASCPGTQSEQPALRC